MNVGFSGTRRGMSPQQIGRVRSLLSGYDGLTAHHGDCLGADEQFHRICRERPVCIVIHPSTHRLRAFCAGDEIRETQPPLRRNAAIVGEVRVMIATPYEDEPQIRGGTWSTVRLALSALRRGLLSELFVVGRAGQLLDHGSWR